MSLRHLFLSLLFLAPAFWSGNSFAAGSCAKVFRPVLEKVFREYLPQTKEGWCSGNVYFELKKVLSEGGSLDDIQVLFFYNSRARDFRLWGTSDKKLNEFHVVIYRQGLVYDVHSAHPEPMPLKEYLGKMFFEDGAFRSESFLSDLIHVRDFSAANYLLAFKSNGSGKLRDSELGLELGSLRDL